jgi:hypothetical protein
MSDLEDTQCRPEIKDIPDKHLHSAHESAKYQAS